MSECPEATAEDLSCVPFSFYSEGPSDIGPTLNRCTFSTPDVAGPDCSVDVKPHPLPPVTTTTVPDPDILPITGPSLVGPEIAVGAFFLTIGLIVVAFNNAKKGWWA